MRIIPNTPTAPEPSAASSCETAPSPAPVPPAPAPAWRARAILDSPVTANVLHAAWSGDPLVLVPAPPGSGKSRLVALLAATLADRVGLRVGVAAQTREQAAELARRIGALTDHTVLGWSKGQALPDLGGVPVTVTEGRSLRYPGTRGGVVIATTALWLNREPGALGADVLVVDEAWQATYADLGALGAFASQVVAVGDPGQIDPVVTGETGRWAASRTAPHLPGPDALLSAHGDAASVVALRYTYRLGPVTTALIQPVFYPALPFTSRRPPEHVTDKAGQVLPEVVAAPVTVTGGPGDPILAHACADRVRALVGARLTTGEGTRLVTAADVIVTCAHVSQAGAVRALLADLPDVLVGTTNAVQGSERAVAVVLHPLAGYREVTPFGTDPGRTCVMLSRHRAHMTLVTDTATPEVLARSQDPHAPMHGALLAGLPT